MIAARVLLLLSLGASLACVAEPSAPQPGPRRVDKQAMFGSAGLVPTREGERARRELAIAGELEAALEQLGLGPAHVDVELREPAAVIVIASAPDEHEPDAIEAEIAALTRALVPELEPAGLHVRLRPSAARVEGSGRRSSARPWALMLVCLGLGSSLGIVGERLRLRLR